MQVHHRCCWGYAGLRLTAVRAVVTCCSGSSQATAANRHHQVRGTKLCGMGQSRHAITLLSAHAVLFMLSSLFYVAPKRSETQSKDAGCAGVVQAAPHSKVLSSATSMCRNEDEGGRTV
jgi:hypothetical protein